MSYLTTSNNYLNKRGITGPWEIYPPQTNSLNKSLLYQVTVSLTIYHRHFLALEKMTRYFCKIPLSLLWSTMRKMQMNCLKMTMKKLFSFFLLPITALYWEWSIPLHRDWSCPRRKLGWVWPGKLEWTWRFHI